MINFNRAYSFDQITQARAEILYAMAIESFIHNDMRAGYEADDIHREATAFAFDQINTFDKAEIDEWFQSVTCGLHCMDVDTHWSTGELNICLIDR